jgi:hypothetical protein
MQIVDVDDFAPHELGVAGTRTFPRAITPTLIAPAAIEPTALEGDRPCAY